MSTPLYDAWSTRANQTVAFDDVLVGRLRFCTVCGRPSTQREGGWLGGAPTGLLAIAYALCERCLGHPRDSLRRLDARMRQRYGVEDDETTKGKYAN